MPTQPVVLACKVNVMVSPLTAYVTLYAPFDEDLLPKHMSASCKYKTGSRLMWVYLSYDNCTSLHLKGIGLASLI